MAGSDLEHVTINTGASRISARREVDESVVDHVRAGLAAGGDVGGGWSVRLVAAPEGLHVYDLLHEGVAMVTCVLCVDPRLSLRAWNDVLRAAPPGVRLHEPTLVPWLAVIIRMTDLVTADPTLFADVIQQAGDLERVVAWALID